MSKKRWYTHTHIFFWYTFICFFDSFKNLGLKLVAQQEKERGEEEEEKGKERRHALLCQLSTLLLIKSLFYFIFLFSKPNIHKFKKLKPKQKSNQERKEKREKREKKKDIRFFKNKNKFKHKTNNKKEVKINK